MFKWWEYATATFAAIMLLMATPLFAYEIYGGAVHANNSEYNISFSPVNLTDLTENAYFNVSNLQAGTIPTDISFAYTTNTVRVKSVWFWNVTAAHWVDNYSIQELNYSCAYSYAIVDGRFLCWTTNGTTFNGTYNSVVGNKVYYNATIKTGVWNNVYADYEELTTTQSVGGGYSWVNLPTISFPPFENYTFKAVMQTTPNSNGEYFVQVGEHGSFAMPLWLDPWFNPFYPYRRQLNLTNNNATTALVADYTYNASINHATLVSTGKSLSNGNDFRVVCDGIERDRRNVTDFNTANTIIEFSLPVSIAAGSYNDTCYFYYGYAGAGTPPSNWENIYVFGDNLDTLGNFTTTAFWVANSSFGWQGNGTRAVGVGSFDGKLIKTLNMTQTRQRFLVHPRDTFNSFSTPNYYYIIQESSNYILAAVEDDPLHVNPKFWKYYTSSGGYQNYSNDLVTAYQWYMIDFYADLNSSNHYSLFASTPYNFNSGTYKNLTVSGDTNVIVNKSLNFSALTNHAYNYFDIDDVNVMYYQTPSPNSSVGIEEMGGYYIITETTKPLNTTYYYDFTTSFSYYSGSSVTANCTSYLDGAYFDTRTALNDTVYSDSLSGLSAAQHYYTVNCTNTTGYYGFNTTYFTFSHPDVNTTIFVPLDTGIYPLSFNTNFSFNSTLAATANCTSYLDGAYYATRTASNYTTYSDALTALSIGSHNYSVNCSNTSAAYDYVNHNFTIANPRIVIYAFDEQTGDRIYFDASFNNGTNLTTFLNVYYVNETTATLPFGSNVMLTIANSSFYPRNYYLTIAPSTNVTLSTYLLNLSATAIFVRFHVRNTLGAGIANASVLVERTVNGTLVPVSSLITDGVGDAADYFELNHPYAVVVGATGYNMFYTTITMTQNDYTITLMANSSGYNGTNWGNYSISNTFDDVIWTLTPYARSLSNQTENITLYVISPHSTLQYWGMQVDYANGTNLCFINSTSASGGIAYCDVSHHATIGDNMSVSVWFSRSPPAVFTIIYNWYHYAVNATMSMGQWSQNYAQQLEGNNTALAVMVLIIATLVGVGIYPYHKTAAMLVMLGILFFGAAASWLSVSIAGNQINGWIVMVFVTIAVLGINYARERI